MARVAAPKTALPHNHPLQRPLKKRQAEACQRIHALWGVWPWELLISVVMYELQSSSNVTASSSPRPYRYQLEHPQEWSDNILDTLRKLALSTTLQHAVARLGFHAALLKVSRLSVRLTKAVTTECEVEREHTPPNLKAGSGPIVNRRNKKTLLSSSGSPEASDTVLDRDQHYILNQPDSMHQMTPSTRRKTDPEEGQQHRAYQFPHRHSFSQPNGPASGPSHRQWPSLTLPNLHEIGPRHRPHAATHQPAFSPTTTGLITPISEDASLSGLAGHEGLGVCNSNSNSRFPFPNSQPSSSSTSPTRQSMDEDEQRKRKTSPTVRDAMASKLNDLSVSDAPYSRPHAHHHTEETLLAKRQRRTLPHGFAQLRTLRVELTPPTSPSSPPRPFSLRLPAMNSASTTSSSSSASSPPPSATFFSQPSSSCSSSSSSLSVAAPSPSYTAYTAAAAAVATLQRANSLESRSSQAQQQPAITRHQLPPIKSQPANTTAPMPQDSSMCLPPMLASGTHQRHHSYNHRPGNSAEHQHHFQQQAGLAQPPPLPPLSRPVLPGRSVSSYAVMSGPATSSLSAGVDSRMKMSFLL